MGLTCGRGSAELRRSGVRDGAVLRSSAAAAVASIKAATMIAILHMPVSGAPAKSCV